MIDMYAEAEQHAAKIREYYDAYRRMGFSDEQAFTLTHSVQQAVLMLALGEDDDE